MHLETERLVVRPWRHDEGPRLFDILSRVEVMKWLGDGEPRLVKTVGEAHERIDRYNHERADPPLGVWAVERKEDGVVAGTALLLTLPNDEHGEVEIGWHLHPGSWGHRYAPEAATAILDRGFAGGLAEINAVTHLTNARSMAVCSRIGMEHRGITHRWYAEPSQHYVITREQWAARQAAPSG